MPMPRKEIDFDKTYVSKIYGPFKILNEEPPKYYANGSMQRQVRIRFINTGTERIVNLSSALKGSAVDPYAKTVQGIGYWGPLKDSGQLGIDYTLRQYEIWFHMIERCYSITCKAYPTYGGRGVTVDPRWHCFTNFVRDFPFIKGYQEYMNASEEEKSEYHLDKDSLQFNVPYNQRVYSKDTCVLIKGVDNIRYAAVDSKAGTSSPYFGVYRNPNGRTFQASFMLDGKKYFLGTFNNEVAAATVYNFVVSKCVEPLTYNVDLPYMGINEALSHRISRTPLILPPQINTDLLNTSPSNKSSIYTGVCDVSENGNPKFSASYSVGKNKYNIGRFDNEIAAANAHNYYANMYNPYNSHINQVPYMNAAEWLSHKLYPRSKKPVEMCREVNKYEKV